MRTPIVDFLKDYQKKGMARFHMPGHKGKNFLGCEPWDITEIDGADSLYEASGIIAESERNASALFGSQKTCYSVEGSSHCIRTMLYLALTNRPKNALPVIVAARNVHKAFVYAAALLGFDIVWLWPEESRSLCCCPVTAASLEAVLSKLSAPPAAVYITSPDYLGSMADIRSLADVCHRQGTILAVDNAHGAYLHFLPCPAHPLDLGADICCDSAHKTLPVLTGGAYLHISDNLPQVYAHGAKAALALFGSTSPSYLIMASLDNCNRYLAEEYPARLSEYVSRMAALRRELQENGWQLHDSDPLRLTVCAPSGTSGFELGEKLRHKGMECEYADDSYLVLMVTPENTDKELAVLPAALGYNHFPAGNKPVLPLARSQQVISVRDAFFAPHEVIPATVSLGRICGSPIVSCPPAIPIAITGEIIGPEACELFRYYGIEMVDVLK